jgi:hypothetical protein
MTAVQLNKSFKLNKTKNKANNLEISWGHCPQPYPNSVPTNDCTLRLCFILLSTLRALRSLSTPECFCTPQAKFENLSMMAMITYN